MAEPYSKEQQLSRGERRYRRKIASPKQWQAIIEAKRGPCRVPFTPSFVSRPDIEYHHLIARAQGGDDHADNIVPLCGDHHALAENREPHTLAAIAASLTDAEYAYVTGKLGEGGIERLFGAVAPRETDG